MIYEKLASDTMATQSISLLSVSTKQLCLLQTGRERKREPHIKMREKEREIMCDLQLESE